MDTRHRNVCICGFRSTYDGTVTSAMNEMTLQSQFYRYFVSDRDRRELLTGSLFFGLAKRG
jgi:hypothetical protein